MQITVGKKELWLKKIAQTKVLSAANVFVNETLNTYLKNLKILKVWFFYLQGIEWINIQFFNNAIICDLIEKVLLAFCNKYKYWNRNIAWSSKDCEEKNHLIAFVDEDFKIVLVWNSKRVTNFVHM